jgi:hypothetical protein
VGEVVAVAADIAGNFGSYTFLTDDVGNPIPDPEVFRFRICLLQKAEWTGLYTSVLFKD